MAELAEILNRSFEIYDKDSCHIDLSDSFTRSHEGKWLFPAVIARGSEDGSVNIGPTTLNLREKMDSGKINIALAKACNHPGLVVHR